MEDLAKVVNENGVGELILNRPKQRNSLIGPLIWELQSGLESLEEDPDCKAIIIRGADGYFCAGLDLIAMSADPAPKWRSQFGDDWARFHKTIYCSNKPIIGALEGFAIAGGSALALACDFLIVGEGAFLHVAEIERGMMAPINILWLHLRHSYHKSLKMALLGERHYGESLVNLGIADQCVPDSEVVAAARSVAERFSGFDASAIRRLKAAIKSVDAPENFDELLDTIKQSAE